MIITWDGKDLSEEMAFPSQDTAIFSKTFTEKTLIKKILFSAETSSETETEGLGRQLAEALAAELESRRFVLVALSGELGAGKTAFTRGLVRYFSESAYVHSPSYTIVNEYKGLLPSGGRLTAAHFDIWRLKDEDDLYSVGYFDWFPYDGHASDKAVLMAVEWCDNVPGAMPESFYRVDIKGSGDAERTITVSHIDNEQ